MSRRLSLTLAAAVALATAGDARAQDEPPAPDDWEEGWAEDAEDDGDEAGASADDGAEDGPSSFRIDDELEEVGADVTFSESDLASDAAGGDAAGAGVTRLETLAMAYLRSGIDLVHDQVPAQVAGVDVVGEETIAFRAHGRAEGVSRFGRRVKVKVAGRVNIDLATDSDTNLVVQRYEADVWDTYADLYADWMDLRVGNQIVAWGTADLLSPNDVVNPRDLRRGFLEPPDELRRPVLAVNARAYEGPLSLELLWIPVAPTNRFELLDGDYALLGPNAATYVERRVGAILTALADDPMAGLALRPLLDLGEPPDEDIESGELGGSLALRTRALDLYLYGLWQRERNPVIDVHPQLREFFLATPAGQLTPEALGEQVQMLAAMGADPVQVSYPRRVHTGAALATRVEPIGVKLDVAYAFDAHTLLVPPGAGPLLGTSAALPQAGATLSLDYDRGTTMAFVLEGSYVRYFDLPEGLAVFQYDQDELLVAAAQARWAPANGPLSLRFLGFYDVSNRSYALQPALRLSGHDNLSLDVAVEVFGGPPGTLGGVPDHNDQVVLTFQYGL